MRTVLINILLALWLFTELPTLYAELDNQVFNESSCGLKYIHKERKITNRFPSPAGSTLPLQFNISELPSKCTEIRAAYLWWTVSYRENSQKKAYATVQTPYNQHKINAELIGEDIDKCWKSDFGEIGTRAYRADITEAIIKNGLYYIDISTPGEETDGVTLLIIYRDLKSSDEGHLIINDGLITRRDNKVVSQTLENFSVCENSSSAQAFLIVSDLQNSNSEPAEFTLNGESAVIERKFWNSEFINTSVTTEQNKYDFAVDSKGDCFSWAAMGLYYQTKSCTPCPVSLDIRATIYNNNICRGEQTTITVRGADFYEWTSNPPGFTGSGDIIQASPKQTTTYIIHGVSADSCFKGTAYAVVFVNEPPMVNAGKDIISCPGTEKRMKLSVEKGTPPYKYQWTPGNGLSDSLVANPYFNIDKSAEYIVKVEDSKGCTGQDTIKIIIHEGPDVSAGEDQQGCRDNYTLKAATGSGEPPYRFEWSPAELTDNPNDSAVTVHPIRTTDFIVTCTDANGCTDSDTVRITIESGPRFTEHNYFICSGDSIQIGGDITDGTPPYECIWDDSPDLVGNSSHSPFVFPQSDTFFTVQITDATGCSGYDTIRVAVGNSPLFGDNPDITVCSGDSVYFAPKIISVDSVLSYHWHPAEYFDNPEIKNPNAYFLSNSVVVITVSDSNGCSANDTINIFVKPAPEIITSSDTAVCIGNFAELSCSVEGGKKPYSYNWSPEELLLSSSDSSVQAKPLSPTMFYITITDAEGCISSDSIFVDVFDVIKPVLNFSDTVFICNGDSIVLKTTTEYENYMWSDGSTNSNLTVKDSGSYYVRTENSAGCSAFSDTVMLRVKSPGITIRLDKQIYSAAPGDTAEISIYLQSVQNFEICKPEEISFAMEVNKTLLVPLEDEYFGDITGDKRIINFSLPAALPEDKLITLKFLATLGNADSTEIIIAESGSASAAMKTEAERSIFRLEGICSEGHTPRTIHRAVNTGYLRILPNPAGDKISFEFHLTESNTKLSIYDLSGRLIDTPFTSSEKKGFISFEYDASQLAPGVYSAVLLNGNHRYTEILCLVK